MIQSALSFQSRSQSRLFLGYPVLSFIGFAMAFIVFFISLNTGLWLLLIIPVDLSFLFACIAYAKFHEKQVLFQMYFNSFVRSCLG